MTSPSTPENRARQTPQACSSRGAWAYKTIASRIFRAFDHLLCQRPTFRGRVPLRSDFFFTRCDDCTRHEALGESGRLGCLPRACATVAGQWAQAVEQRTPAQTICSNHSRTKKEAQNNSRSLP